MSFPCPPIPRMCRLLLAAACLLVNLGPAVAADLEVEDDTPDLRFDDTDNGDGEEWTIRTLSNGGQIVIQNDNSLTLPFVILNSAPENALRVEGSSGDASIGIGGNPLGESIEIFSDLIPDIEFNDTDGTPYTWQIEADSDLFRIEDTTGGNREPFRIEPGSISDALRINSSGNVGLGTPGPAFPLHVVRDIVPTTTIAKFEQISVNKPVIVQFQNKAPASTSNACGFDYLLRDQTSSKIVGRFVCSLVDTTGDAATAAMQFQVMNDGATAQAMKIQGNRVSIGTSVSTDLLRVLNARCNGATWNDACSRELKQDVAELDSEEAQETLAGLTPVTYAYKHEPEEPRVGFIAEDVPQRVALADGKSLSSMDIVAVLTKVTQEHQRQLREKDQEIAELREKLESENTALRTRLDRIETILAQ